MSDPLDVDMDENQDSRAFNIGKCQKCQYFDVERQEEIPTDETLAPCLHPDMEEFALIVSGDSGCNLFELAEELEEDDEDEEDEEV